MTKRLISGLIKGLLVGALVAAALVSIGAPTVGPLLAYTAAVVTGVLTGLIAGRPLWKPGARIEAGLKAGAGAIIAVIAMFGMRKWLGVHVDLSALGAGAGRLGDLPAASLPIIATVLAVIFDLDNNGEEPESENAGAEQRVAAGSKHRVEGLDDEVLVEDEVAETGTRRREV